MFESNHSKSEAYVFTKYEIKKFLLTVSQNVKKKCEYFIHYRCIIDALSLICPEAALIMVCTASPHGFDNGQKIMRFITDLSDGEVAGWLGEQVLRTLVSPGMIVYNCHVTNQYILFMS